MDLALAPFKHSLFITRQYQKSPETFQTWLDSGDFFSPYESETYARRLAALLERVSNETDLAAALRRFRNREMVRIAWRDLEGLAPLNETLEDLSSLADSLIVASLAKITPWIEAKYGTPIGEISGQKQALIVIGMGKLGARELNFSSDIDLIFTFAEEGQTQGGRMQLSNGEFFIRLGQALNKSLSSMTADGFVFRVDMRLRPFGDSGALASSFAALEQYYYLHGRPWERYAMIKARAITGEPQAIKNWQKLVRPFVFRRYVDFSVLDAMRDLKAQISRKVREKGMENNIKLGEGGIREIEFIAQIYQLIHGGRDVALQGRAMKAAYARLQERGDLPPEQVARLLAAYDFLRLVENRLQMWEDGQTHDLPDEALGERWQSLTESMGFERLEDFKAQLNLHRANVAKAFKEVLAEAEPEADLAGEAEIQSWSHPDYEAFKQSRAYRMVDTEGLERLNRLLPSVFARVEQHTEPQTLARVLSVIEAILRRSVYLVLLAENSHTLDLLVKLCAASPWVSRYLSQHPSLLDQLLDARSLMQPITKDSLNARLAHEQLNWDSARIEQTMDGLRDFKNSQLLRIAAADVLGLVPTNQVSDYLTWLAEVILQACIPYAASEIAKRFGYPEGMSETHLPFILVGFGKLGGIELGYGSDLDVVMLYDLADDKVMTQGARQVTAQEFFIALGRKLINFITTLTSAGVLYDLDSRLRPNGASGTLVISLEAFEKYERGEAWTWEHQALLRSRAVAGDAVTVQAYEQTRMGLLTADLDGEKLKDEVMAMREKMRGHLDKTAAEIFDLKQGVGGIVDIEFMVQYLCLAHAPKSPEIVTYSDNLRQLEALAQVGVLKTEQAQRLIEIYLAYRGRYHQLSLQDAKGLVSSEEFSEERAQVSAYWAEIFC
jgi:glutamate-ammonia-ligase adenylyltransferase